MEFIVYVYWFMLINCIFFQKNKNFIIMIILHRFLKEFYNLDWALNSYEVFKNGFFDDFEPHSSYEKNYYKEKWCTYNKI